MRSGAIFRFGAHSFGGAGALLRNCYIVALPMVVTEQEWKVEATMLSNMCSPWMSAVPTPDPLTQTRVAGSATIKTLALAVQPAEYEVLQASNSVIVDVTRASGSICGKSVIVGKQLSEFGQLVAVFRT